MNNIERNKKTICYKKSNIKSVKVNLLNMSGIMGITLFEHP